MGDHMNYNYQQDKLKIKDLLLFLGLLGFLAAAAFWPVESHTIRIGGDKFNLTNGSNNMVINGSGFFENGAKLLSSASSDCTSNCNFSGQTNLSGNIGNTSGLFNSAGQAYLTSAGASTLSGLTVDSDKNWIGSAFTNLSKIEVRGNSSAAASRIDLIGSNITNGVPYLSAALRYFSEGADNAHTVQLSAHNMSDASTRHAHFSIYARDNDSTIQKVVDMPYDVPLADMHWDVHTEIELHNDGYISGSPANRLGFDSDATGAEEGGFWFGRSTNNTGVLVTNFYQGDGSSTQTVQINHKTGSVNGSVFYDDGERLPIINFTNQLVFNSTSPGGGFVDLDLSGQVGSRRVLVFLKVQLTGTASESYFFRPNGETLTSHTDGAAGGVITTQLRYIDVIVQTDSSGIIEWSTSAGKSTVVWLTGFMG
jgi:hypothetical protein